MINTFDGFEPSGDCTEQMLSSSPVACYLSIIWLLQRHALNTTEEYVCVIVYRLCVSLTMPLPSYF